MLYAVLADLAIAEKIPWRAKQAVIVQRLHHRNSGLGARPVDGRRDDHEGIVDVRDVRFLAAEQGEKLAPGRLRPHGAPRQTYALKCRWMLRNFAVIALVDEYLVSGLRQHLALLLEHGVFPARLLVGVVHQENFHRGMTRPGPAPQERSGG